MIKHCIKFQCILLEKTDLMSTCASTSCLTPGKLQNQEVISTSQRDYLHYSETADNSDEVRREREMEKA